LKLWDEPVSEAQFEKIIRAAMAAANSGNQQPWRFNVIDDVKLRDTIGALDIERGTSRVSPQLIFVCADVGSMQWKMHWLGGGWQELYPYHRRVAKVRELLGITETVYPMAVIPIGYPVQRPEPADRYDPGKIKQNQW
jgi:nitroreductase